MYEGLRIAVVIPAFNAGWRLQGVLESLPGFMDLAVVVDDGSSKPEAARACPAGLDLITVNHGRNLGTGAAVLTGYRTAREARADIAVVMAADGQMDPADAERLIEPVARGLADYAKGDRLSHPDCRKAMPAVRRVGNCCLTWLTRRTTGLSGLMDSQCGYTALRLACLEALPLDWLYPRYGFPNDMLAAVAGAGLRVSDVVVRPVYDGEQSGIRPWQAAVVYPVILARGLLVRAVAWGREGRKRTGS